MELGTIQLPMRTIQALSDIAREKGKTTEQYVYEILETQILASKSFDEILAPIRQGFKESGMSEDEITAMFEKARDEVYQDNLAKKK
jgi:predicted DNA-binding protein